MSRFAFNAICSILMIAIMGALAFVLKQLPDQFVAGLGLGSFLTLLSLWIAHKLGHDLY